MDQSEVLGTAAQIAVAVGGFAGVVVAFRSGSVHEWSAMDRFRLRLLLANSILPLALSSVALVLLAVVPVPTSIWAWCSALTATVLFPRALLDLRMFLRLAKAPLETGTRPTFFTALTIGTAFTVLQVYNVTTLHAFWPFFAAVMAQLFAGMFQFVRLVFVPRKSTS